MFFVHNLIEIDEKRKAKTRIEKNLKTSEEEQGQG